MMQLAFLMIFAVFILFTNVEAIQGVSYDDIQVDQCCPRTRRNYLHKVKMKKKTKKIFYSFLFSLRTVLKFQYLILSGQQ